MISSNSETASTSPTKRSSHLGWVLDGTTLHPGASTAQKIVQVLNAKADDAPEIFVTFTFPCFPKSASVQIHRLLLEAAPTPLSSLLAHANADAATDAPPRSVELHEHPDVFAIVRKFLYGIPIDLSVADARLPAAAHRWELKSLSLAYFSVMMRSRWSPTATFARVWPVLTTLVAPWQFQNYLARLVGFNIVDFEKTFGWQAVWGDFQDDHGESRSLQQVAADHMSDHSSEHSGSPGFLDDSAAVGNAGVQHGGRGCRECDTNMTSVPDESECVRTLQEAPLGIWKAFQFQGKLSRVIWALSRFGSCDRSKHLLYVTQQLQKRLSDEELEDIVCFLGEGSVLIEAASDTTVQPHVADQRLLRAAIRVVHRVRWYVDHIATYRGDVPTTGESFKQTLECVRGASLVGAEVVAEVSPEDGALVLQIKCEAFGCALFHISAEVSLNCCDCVVPFGGVDVTKHSVLNRRCSEKMRTKFEFMSSKDLADMRSLHTRCDQSLRLVVLLQPR